jgi:hypothetical protein
VPVAGGIDDHHADADTDADVDCLVRWVNLPDWARSLAFLGAHPGLVGDAGIAELYRQAIRQPRAVTGPDARRPQLLDSALDDEVGAGLIDPGQHGGEQEQSLPRDSASTRAGRAGRSLDEQ